MFATSKIVRLAFWACLAMAWLPIGNSVCQPSQAKAVEIVRVVPPVVRVVPAAPVVRVGPVYPRFWYRPYYGYRWHR
jgi:hypothetical protein